MDEISNVGQQVLYMGKYNWRVAYVLVDRTEFILDGGGYNFIAAKNNCKVLPHLDRPYTLLEAYEWWRFGKETK